MIIDLWSLSANEDCEYQGKFICGYKKNNNCDQGCSPCLDGKLCTVKIENETTFVDLEESGFARGDSLYIDTVFPELKKRLMNENC